MSSIEDPGKLKVVELRAELSSRGLDSRGNKAVLVQRLKEALEKELQTELPDTSILDTSTEELNESVTEPEPADDPEPPEVEEELVPDGQDEQQSTEECDDDPLGASTQEEEKQSSGAEDEEETEDTSKPESVVESGGEQTDENAGGDGANVDEAVESEEVAASAAGGDVVNGDNTDESKVEKKARRNRWTENTDDTGAAIAVDDSSSATAVDGETPMTVGDQKPDVITTSGPIENAKRKRSPSPSGGHQRRRSRSPQIAENEPNVDDKNVQLSWCDSDIYCDIDTQTFTKLKPMTDGALSYMWAGARATHGISANQKVYFEVKLTQEMSTDDIFKHADREKARQRERDRHRLEQKARNASKRSSNNKSESERDRKSDSTSKSGVVSTPASDEAVVKAAEDKSKKEEGDEKVSVEEKDEAVVTDSADSDAKVADPESSDDKESAVPDKEEDDSMNTSVVSEEPAENAVAEVETVKDDATTDAADNKATVDNVDEVKSEDANGTKEEPMEAESDAKDKKDEEEEVKEEKEEPPLSLPMHLFRAGWSLGSSNLQLGEDRFSFGYESTGSLIFNSETTASFGEGYKVGDVLRCYLSIDDEVATMVFSLNGKMHGTPVTTQRSELPEGFAFYPHVLTRNISCELSFRKKVVPPKPVPNEVKANSESTMKENADVDAKSPADDSGDNPPDRKEVAEDEKMETTSSADAAAKTEDSDADKESSSPADEDKAVVLIEDEEEEAIVEEEEQVPELMIGAVFIADSEDKVEGIRRPNRADCEVIMMVGLPGAGKTHWVLNFLGEESTAEKRFIVIGSRFLLDRMTVNGQHIKEAVRGRMSVLIDRLDRTMNRLCDIAAMRRRNFILDQVNVSFSVQRRKMRPFRGYKRRAVYVLPSEEDHTNYLEQQKQEIQDTAANAVDKTAQASDNEINHWKAQYNILRLGDFVDELQFVGLAEDVARPLIEKFVKEARQAGFGGNMSGGSGHGSYNQHRYHHQSGGNRSHGGYGGGGYGGGGRNDDYGRYNRFGGGAGKRDFHSGGGGGGYNREGRGHYGNGPQAARFDNRGGNNRYGGGGGGGSWNSPRSGGGSSGGGGGSWSNNNRQNRRDARGPYHRDWRGGSGSGGVVVSGGRDRRGGGSGGGGGGGRRDNATSGGGNYNRNRSQGYGGSGGGNWSSQQHGGGQWGGSGGWNQSGGAGGGGGSWNQSNQWKYGGGGSSGGSYGGGGYGGGSWGGSGGAYGGYDQYGSQSSGWSSSQVRDHQM